jgi:hypothetical protein
MKWPFLAIAALLSCKLTCQPLGYKEFLIGSKLTDKAFAVYTISPDTTSTNTFIVEGKKIPFGFCNIAIDTLWLRTDSSKKIKAVTIQTELLEWEDFRAHNFEWSTLLQCLENEYGSGTIGEIRFKPVLIALWAIPQNIWLYMTSEKIAPGAKNQKRRFIIHWERGITPKG